MGSKVSAKDLTAFEAANPDCAKAEMRFYPWASAMQNCAPVAGSPGEEGNCDFMYHWSETGSPPWNSEIIQTLTFEEAHKLSERLEKGQVRQLVVTLKEMMPA